MDLSQYAELFLAESREHLSACNQLLLAWERKPASLEPVGGLFRAVHTVKGMADTMGYGVVTDLAHRTESLLDHLRRGAHPATDELLQLLFRARDALEQAVELSVRGRERDLDLSAITAELDRAAARAGGKAGRAAAAREPPPPPIEALAAPGRLVQVVLRAEAPLKGGRALLLLKRAQALGAVHAVSPPPAAFEAEDFDGRLAFRLESAAPADQIRERLRATGDVESVTLPEEEERRAAAPAAAAGAAVEPARSRHLRVDLRRLDGLMDLIGELVTARGRLNELAAERRDPAIDDVTIQISRLTADLQAEIIQARMTPVWQLFDRFPRLVRDLGRELGKQVAFRVEGKEIELERAKRDGVVEARAEALTDDQLLRVLARPGFSTAEQVTSVSGRGVGVDVALTRMRALGGSLELRSEPGKGSTFVLRLPVTLAIVRALIAGVGRERYALPLTHVAETVELGAVATTTVEGRAAIVLRDRVVPLVHLRELLGVTGEIPPGRRPIIVLEVGGRRAGVVVDGMLGQQEIVVKSFDAPQGTLPVFSGATIMGDGIPTLILDAGGLL